jgi:murein DD-endopeptidase MepM/ murein hydrolase activator NlpD
MLAIMENESGGDPNAYNAAGNAYGLFQQLNLGSNDPNVQFAAARTLAEEKLAGINAAYAKNGLNPDARTRALDFAAAWAGHFNYGTGQFNPNSYDPGVNQTAQQWAQVFLGNYDKIKAGRQQPQSGAGIPAGPALQTIFGGQQPPSIMQEFGQTDYSTSHESTYTYGTSYGLPPGSHPGVDYGMPRGTSLYVPVDGVVVYGGGTGYYTDNNGDGPGHGELLIQLANGDQIIMGHMSQITLQPGQHVTAGMLAGLSGGSDGDHLHLEVRQVDHSLPSGYRIVDPRGYFGQR